MFMGCRYGYGQHWKDLTPFQQRESMKVRSIMIKCELPVIPAPRQLTYQSFLPSFLHSVLLPVPDHLQAQHQPHQGLHPAASSSNLQRYPMVQMELHLRLDLRWNVLRCYGHGHCLPMYPSRQGDRSLHPRPLHQQRPFLVRQLWLQHLDRHRHPRPAHGACVRLVHAAHAESWSSRRLRIGYLVSDLHPALIIIISEHLDMDRS